MKKTIFSMLLIGSACAVFAQTDTMNRTINTMSGSTVNQVNSNTADANRLYNTSSYNAFGTFTATPPDYVSSYVIRDYPTANDLKWQQANGWWHAYYMDNNLPTHVYYNDAGQNFIVSLPVKQSLIPESVAGHATRMWGPTVYDITTIKGNNGQDVYHVRTIENGTVSSNWIDENGNKVIDVFRVESSDAGMNQGMNTSGTLNIQTPENNNATGDLLKGVDQKNSKIKIKTETSDGKETKTKIRNGKIVKQKTDD